MNINEKGKRLWNDKKGKNLKMIMELKWKWKEWMKMKKKGIMKKVNMKNEWVTMRKRENVIEKGSELKNEESEWMDKEN